MKKTLIAMAMMLPVLGFAQGNGGISNENASLKLEYVTTNSNTTVVKVTNKDTCTANIRIQWGSLYRSKDVAGLQSDTFQLQTQTARFIMAGSISPCRGYLGIVEIDYIAALPVHFTSITGQRVGPRSIRLIFVAEENANTTKQYNIQYSLDGKTFRTVNVIFPNGIEGHKQYSTIINY